MGGGGAEQNYNTLPGNRNNDFHTVVELGRVLSTTRRTTPFLQPAPTIFTPLWSSAVFSPRRGVQYPSWKPQQLFSHRCGDRQCSLHDEAYNTLAGNRNNYLHTAVCMGIRAGSPRDPSGSDGICIRRRHICPAGSEWIGCDSHQETSHMHHDPCRIWKDSTRSTMTHPIRTRSFRNHINC